MDLIRESCRPSSRRFVACRWKFKWILKSNSHNIIWPPLQAWLGRKLLKIMFGLRFKMCWDVSQLLYTCTMCIVCITLLLYLYRELSLGCRKCNCQFYIIFQTLYFSKLNIKRNCVIIVLLIIPTIIILLIFIKIIEVEI